MHHTLSIHLILLPFVCPFLPASLLSLAYCLQPKYCAVELMRSPNKCQYLFITNFIDCNDSNSKTERNGGDAKFCHDSLHDHLFGQKEKHFSLKSLQYHKIIFLKFKLQIDCVSMYVILLVKNSYIVSYYT